MGQLVMGEWALGQETQTMVPKLGRMRGQGVDVDVDVGVDV